MAEKKKTRFKQEAQFTLTELDQVRVLADPLRIRILEVLCDDERTTKQVAEKLGEKPTKLYHHVEALEKIGLIRETRTRRNRGTLERYYLAIARRFAADPKVFAGEADQQRDETLQSVVETILSGTAQELSRLPRTDEVMQSGMLTYIHVHADQKTIDRLSRRLKKLVQDLQSLDEPGADVPDDRQYRLTLAFYPLDKMDGDSS